MRRMAVLLPILLVVSAVIVVGSGCTQTATSSGASNTEIALPSPTLSGRISVEEALAKRRSVRSFSQEDLTLAEIGQLAWAAQGITDKGGRRTAPSAGAIYPMQLYLVKPDGVFRYLPEGHKLARLAGDDRRAGISTQGSVRGAPLVFVITGDYAKTRARYGDRAERFVDIEAGHIGQNIHLQAVALGLASVSVGAFDDALVAKAMGLPDDEVPLYLIPVGHRAG